MTAKDPESAGIRRKQSRTEDGSKETETEFPNGVKVGITESREVVKDRRTVELGASSLIDLSGAEGQPMRERARRTVESLWIKMANKSAGAMMMALLQSILDTEFTPAYPDGSVRKEAVMRSRDGKNWEVLDLSSLLGSRPGH